MAITVTGRNVAVDGVLREYVEKKVEKIQQHGARLLDVHVILATEKHRAFAEVAMNVNGRQVLAKDETKEIYHSIDRVMEKLERQVMRYRRKRKDLKTRSVSPRSRAAMTGDGHEGVSKEVMTREVPLTAMTIEEAIANMDASDDECLVFTDRNDARLRVIHRRKDGEVEIIDPTS